jgi:hypothetical protein
MGEVRILIAGDLHLGRSSSRIPTDPGVDPTARGGWDRLVDAAIREEVHLLCLSGDVADAHNRFFEALGPLEGGIGRLAAHGIRTVAVTGNHDHDVLPRLADGLDAEHFRLLGRGGRWERYTHEIDGRPVLHVDGWSFAQESVRTSPLATYASAVDPRVPTLGLVHGDLDVADSRYAPLARADLAATGIAGWMLGHIHAPRREEPAGRPFLTYPGSPQALDPGERGVHGAVRLDIVDGRCGPLRVLPLSTVRYEELEVDVTGAETIEDVHGRVIEATGTAATAAAREGGDALAAMSLRLRLTGRTPVAGRLGPDLGVQLSELDRSVAGVRVTIDRTVHAVRPVIDLAEYVDAPTPPGRLARLLVDLDRVPGPGAGAEAGPDELRPETRRVLDEARRRMERERGRSIHRGLLPEGAIVDEATVRRAVRTRAEALLARLLEDSA